MSGDKLIPMSQVTIMDPKYGATRVSGEEIYREYFSDLSTNAFTARLYGLEVETIDRIEYEKQILGFVGYDFSNEAIIPDIFNRETVEECQGFDNSTDFLIGKTLDNDCWAARFWAQIEDDTHCYTLYFTEKPTSEQVMRAYHINDLAMKMRLFPLKQPERFICSSCHQEVFWLDTANDILDCRDNAAEKYCGHC